MFLVDRLILLAGVLLLFAIASSKFSARMGMPVLVLFLGVGMLAGSEGLGNIEFENYSLAHAIGTLALAVILFDGGLRTPLASFRTALRPALGLATAGVGITALITGAAAAWVLDIPLLYGILLGSIVGSTDAAVVFSLLRGSGIRLRERLSATLEVESGSNDPMAVFLTIGVAQVILGDITPGLPLLGFLLLQGGVGAAAGSVVGKLSVFINNRINLDAAGLYPILTAACGLFAYGLAASLNGSGFLSVYVAGIILGNTRIVFQRGILLFTDGMAWLGQIVMFIVLGLLSTPSRIADVAVEGLLISAVLIMVARPAGVFLTLLPFRFTPKELLFLSWVGLKGSVPIILATYPLLMGVENAALLFNVVFFVVLVSALTQGWSLPLVARRLDLVVPSDPEPSVTLEITSLRHVDGDIVEFAVAADSRAANRYVRDLALPEGVVVSMIAREHRIIPPRGSTRVLPGDHVFLVLRPGVRPLVNRAFGPGGAAEDADARVEFPLAPETTVGELEDYYGVQIDSPPSVTIAELIEQRSAPHRVITGDTLTLGDIVLRVKAKGPDGITQLTLEILPPPLPPERAATAIRGRPGPDASVEDSA
jgi:potassium/hydrogen antiporter